MREKHADGGVRRYCLLLGSVMIALGVSLFVAVTALYAFGAYERYRYELASASAGAPETIEGRSDLEVEATMLPQESLARELDNAATVDVPVPTTSPVPARRPAPTWIRIPKIGVDAAVVEAAIKDGEWQVPKFVAGRLEGTANPGEVGNVAISGHVESIASGNVFARLKELAVGMTLPCSRVKSSSATWWPRSRR